MKVVMKLILHDIEQELSSVGLKILGSFNPLPTDEVPGCNQDCSLILVGNAGSDMWRVFSGAGFDEGERNPMDNWSRRVLNDIGNALSGRFDIDIDALFPFDGPPYQPFQRWAARSGCVYPTPIGPMLHEKYGMWHAYRGALIIAATIDLNTQTADASPCLTCQKKPCLTTCPVSAFSVDGYDVPGCLDLLEREPEGACFTGGCLARKACPVGQPYIYKNTQARFHMEKFLAAHRN